MLLRDCPEQLSVPPPSPIFLTGPLLCAPAAVSPNSCRRRLRPPDAEGGGAEGSWAREHVAGGRPYLPGRLEGRTSPAPAAAQGGPAVSKQTAETLRPFPHAGRGAAGGSSGARPRPARPGPPHPPHAAAGQQVGDALGSVVLLGHTEDLPRAPEGHLHGGAGQRPGPRPRQPAERAAAGREVHSQAARMLRAQPRDLASRRPAAPRAARSRLPPAFSGASAGATAPHRSIQVPGCRARGVPAATLSPLPFRSALGRRRSAQRKSTRTLPGHAARDAESHVTPRWRRRGRLLRVVVSEEPRRFLPSGRRGRHAGLVRAAACSPASGTRSGRGALPSRLGSWERR